MPEIFTIVAALTVLLVGLIGLAAALFLLEVASAAAEFLGQMEGISHE